MAPEKKRKREAASNTTPKKDAKSSTTKKPKTDLPKDDREHAGPAVVTSSTLKKVKPAEEETHFPRGGAQVLTPLEYKEVANEAARDVLFGASGKAGDAPVEVSEKAKKVKKFQKRNEKKDGKGKKDGEKEEKETGPKVEGFSYKVRLLEMHYKMYWMEILTCEVLAIDTRNPRPRMRREDRKDRYFPCAS